VTVALDNQPIRLLALLMRNKGHIVEYVTIAQNLGVNFYHENLKNEDLGEPMRDIKKNLRSFLIKIGMTPDEFSSLVTTQKNLGYKLNC
jgi:hypothetical protein